jgi:hypothetical protein
MANQTCKLGCHMSRICTRGWPCTLCSQWREGVLGESLRRWSDYIACNLDQPNKISNKNIRKNISSSMRSTRVTRSRCAHPWREDLTLRKGNPKVREEAEVGDLLGLTLQRETLRWERRPKLEISKEKRTQQWCAGIGQGVRCANVYRQH